MQSKDGVSISLVESGAGEQRKLPLSTLGILGLRYYTKGQTQCPSQRNPKTELQPITSKAVRPN
jgi:hypothetical protein